MTIGNRIKNRRQELNLSVDDLANSLGKNRATVYRYESDDIENLPITILEPLAKVLECTPAYLMGWEDTPSDMIKEVPSEYGFQRPFGLPMHTIAAHHEGEDWTEEELTEIERFKEFVKSRREKK